MPLLLLLFLTLALLPEEWSRPWEPLASPVRSAAVTWLGVALIAAFARAIAAGVARQVTAYPEHRERVLRRYGQLRTYHILLLLGVYAASLYVLGWGWTVQEVCSHGGQMLPGAELVLVAPFLAGLVLSWISFYDAERALHTAGEGETPEPFWPRGAYIAFHLRQNLAFVFAPLLLLVSMKGLHRLYPTDEGTAAARAIMILGVVLTGAVIIGMPWLLRLALGLKPLSPGPLRTRLEASARRLRFRCSDILVWNTRRGVANAMVAGVVPWIRYVVLTDRLMTELTPDEVEAVFGHEIGHVKHHHMVYYLGFLIVSMFLMITVIRCLSFYLPFLDQIDKTITALPLVAMLGPYIFVVFGFLSRRCERQADVFGCRAVSCARPECFGHEAGLDLAPRGRGLCPTGIGTFIEALEKVARLNGISRDKPGLLGSWLHSTIALRVEFLQDVRRDPTVERRFQRRVALVKWGLFLGLLAAFGALGYAASELERKSQDEPPAGSEVQSLTPHTAEHTAPSE